MPRRVTAIRTARAAATISNSRRLAGIARARSEGRALGRKPLEETDAAKVTAIRTARAKGFGLRQIATDLHVGVGTVLRVLGKKRHRATMAE